MKYANLVLPEKLFDLVSFGYFKNIPLYSSTTLIYSLALTYHPRIRSLIKEAQQHLPGFPYPYPTERDFRLITYIQEPLDKDIRDYVFKASHEIVNKLGWNNRWEDIVMVKIYTDILPIPSEMLQFNFVDANKRAFRKNDEPKESIKSLLDIPKSSALAVAMELSARADNSNYPFIAIRERLTSKKPLIDYINRNFDTMIKPATEILPNRKHKQADVDRFMLSVWLFDLIHNRHLKPKQIDEMIEKEDPDQQMFGKHDMTSTGISKLADEARVKLGEIFPL